MVEEMMMVPTSDYNNLVNYYKGRLTESALLNKAGRLAAERHVTLNSPHLNKSVAVAMSKQGEREIHKLTKRLRTGGTTRGTSVTGGKEDEDDDAMLVSPLEHKLDKILRATEKTFKQQPQRELVPPTRRRQLPKTPKTHPVKQEEVSTKSSKSGWISSMKSGALKGLGNSLGVNASRTSDTDSDDEGATRQKKKKPTPKAVKRLRTAPGWEDFTEGVNASRTSDTDSDDEGATRQKIKKPTPKAVKRLRTAPGWEDFTEGKKLRRVLLSDYEDDESDEDQI